MIPTPYLRFIEREIVFDKEYIKSARVLQQKWVDPNTGKEIWKDVELVKE
jgi:hypothetical protein